MGLKLNTEKVKTRKVKRFSNTVKISVLLGVIVALVIGGNIYSQMQLKDTVEIVKLRSAVPQDGLILPDNMYKDTMLRSEYEKQGLITLSDGSRRRAIVLWEDRERVNNVYASYYIRQDTPLYWDSLSRETPKKYSYLYKMDGELLRLPLNAGEFGKMLVPGDKVNIRVTYTENEYTLPTEREFMIQQQTGIQMQTSVTKTEMLFNNVTVLDILNSNGDSIFDIYYRLLALPKPQQYSIINSSEFVQQVIPSVMMLNVTPEEVERYTRIVRNNPSYTMTLLPRTSGNLITEALNELQIGFARND